MKKSFHLFSHPLPTWLGISLLAALVAGCGGGGGYGSSGMPYGSGTLGVSLTDTPACGFDAVNVTVTQVRVHQSSSATPMDAGWTNITLSPARKINLLDLNNGVLDSLGETPLPAGHYTQVRLVLADTSAGGLANSVIPSGGAETSLTTPSAMQTGIKLITPFDVQAGMRTDLLLDFDACKSVVMNGSGHYMLTPVVTSLPFAVNGIDGFVDPALLSSNVLVTAQQNGVVVQSTAPTTTGEFFLSHVAPGNYDVVITADNHATAVITSVPVASSTSVVNISTLAMPFTLPLSATHLASGTVTLNPASATAAAYVDATQSAPPLVTVKSQAADLTTGAYSLILPVAAPQLGSYGALPIMLNAAQSGVAGAYTLNVSANGYLAQSAPANVSTGDVTGQNFTLSP